MTTVRDILLKKGRAVWSVAPTAPVFDAIKEMAERSIGALLVMDGPRLTGIISERDYARKVILQGRSSKATLVQEVMASSLLCCGLDTTIEECMGVMTTRRVRHLPVLDGEKVAGVISIGDVVKFVITDQKQEIDELVRYVSG